MGNLDGGKDMQRVEIGVDHRMIADPTAKPEIAAQQR
ncbi:MAG: hypothetical protein RL472_2248, partial [Pseudomonadota bacterium]